MRIIFTEGFVYTKGITTYMYLMLEKTMILNFFRNIMVFESISDHGL